MIARRALGGADSRVGCVDQNAVAAAVTLDAATLALIDALVPMGLAVCAALFWRCLDRVPA
jgi:hypothetical protein